MSLAVYRSVHFNRCSRKSGRSPACHWRPEVKRHDTLAASCRWWRQILLVSSVGKTYVEISDLISTVIAFNRFDCSNWLVNDFSMQELRHWANERLFETMGQSVEFRAEQRHQFQGFKAWGGTALHVPSIRRERAGFWRSIDDRIWDSG